MLKFNFVDPNKKSVKFNLIQIFEYLNADLTLSKYLRQDQLIKQRNN